MIRPSTPLALLSLGGTAVYLGIVVVVRGGPAVFLGLPALVVLAALTIVASLAGLFSGAGLRSGVREDRSNRWVLAAFGVLGMLETVVPPWCDRTGVLTFGGGGVRWLGVAVYAAGGWLRIWPTFVLGVRFSGLVAIQPGHRLETAGPYRVLRHPSYLGLIVMTLGWGLAFRSWLGVALAVLTIPPLLARIASEERLLAATFGDEYAAWRARTARLLPGLW